jgi:hypothetical protein
MKPDEYDEWKGDERVGECPFCGAPGWITGDDEWCAHYMGSVDDLDSKRSACDPLEGCEALLRFSGVVNRLSHELTKDEISGFAKLSPASRELLAIAKNYASHFWERLIPVKTLHADVSSTLYDTSYTSYFTADRQHALSHAEAMVERAWTEFQSEPRLLELIKPANDEPAE